MRPASPLTPIVPLRGPAKPPGPESELTAFAYHMNCLMPLRLPRRWPAVLAALLLMAPAGSALAVSREQELEMVCGPLCLAFCAEWLGARADVEEVAKAAGTDAIAGTSFAGLMRAAAELGLEARALRLSLADLRRVTPRTPAIVHVDGSHVVVAWMGEPGAVTVMQPPTGLRRMSPGKFGRRWNGAALMISLPGEQPKWDLGYLRWAVVTAGVLLLAAVLLPRRRRTAPPKLTY